MTKPDPDDMNESRAAWAGECIALLAEITGCENGEQAAGDLLCNLFHWCDANGVDIERLLFRARSNYDAETDFDGRGAPSQGAPHVSHADKETSPNGAID